MEVVHTHIRTLTITDQNALCHNKYCFLSTGHSHDHGHFSTLLATLIDSYTSKACLQPLFGFLKCILGKHKQSAN